MTSQPRIARAASAAPASTDSLSASLLRAVDALVARQESDGHWVFELEADATIPAEFILLNHYLDETDPGLEARIAVFLRAIQGADGGWPLFHGGAMELSASVKAYFALKMAGDDPQAAHMVRAREAILARGGAARVNVFTRIQLALFGEVPWPAVPVMPVEIMHLPRWFPFHLDKVSYWSRTVMVPLLVLMAKKPRARNPRGVSVAELFAVPPAEVTRWGNAADRSFWGAVFRHLDRLLRLAEPLMPPAPRQKAIDKAVAFITERLNGEDGLGAIYPAMANALMVFDLLGYAREHPLRCIARRAIDKLVVLEPGRTYVQPCVSPVWDTGLAAHALLEAGDVAAARRGTDWLAPRQVTQVIGDWARVRPGLKPGGWPFQYGNDHYPDLDDTAVVVMALDRVDRERYRPEIDRAAEWVLGMQCRNGGWASFDADNESYYLNHIPFADHGALLDPPTADVTARCLSMLAQLGYGRNHQAVKRGLDFLQREQERDGSWFGRWGTNYIYGTWSVLCALNACSIDMKGDMVRRAVDWLLAKQRPDGGWGEDSASYWPEGPRGDGPVGTASQTAWAVLGLMAAGEVDHAAVRRGIDWLLANQNPEGLWDEAHYTAVGFPRVFYLRYHGYRAFFPLWAVARYKALTTGNATQVLHGM